MDSMTHILTGGVIARAIDDQKVGTWGTIAGLAVGFFPDTDVVLRLINQQFYLEFHRDFTHSLILIPFYALFFSWVFVKLSKRPHFWSYYKICLPVLASHVLLDLFTSYGTMIFSPFFEHRYALDLVFVIDLIFSGIIIFPFIVSLFWKRRSRLICRGALIGLGVYVFFCWMQHGRALELTKTFAHNLDEEVLKTASLPQPLSPFRWANYIETEDRVYRGFIDFLRKEPPESIPHSSSSFKKLNNLYYPPEKSQYQSWAKLHNSPLVEKALATDGVKFYYWFARFPVVRSINSNNGWHRVEFMDMSFVLPGIRTPFVYHVEFDDSGKIQSEGFEGDGKKQGK